MVRVACHMLGTRVLAFDTASNARTRAHLPRSWSHRIQTLQGPLGLGNDVSTRSGLCLVPFVAAGSELVSF